MRKKRSRTARDPYYYWKVVNIALACAVLILAVLILLGKEEAYLAPAACLAGAVMCALDGIMGLAKGRRVTGYVCSIISGVLAVALMFDLIRLWFL